MVRNEPDLPDPLERMGGFENMSDTRPSGKYKVQIQEFEHYRARASCQNACPLGTDTKGYTRAIAEGDYTKAYLIARRANPLVSVCSRVCHAPCETSCAKGATQGPVSVRLTLFGRSYNATYDGRAGIKGGNVQRWRNRAGSNVRGRERRSNDA